MTVRRARIVKATGVSPPEPAPLVQATHLSRVAREVLLAREAAADLVAEARAQAKAILAEAKASASAVAESAANEAKAAEEAKLAVHYLHLKKEEAERAEADLDRAIALAVVLAERLLGAALERDPGHIALLARKALAEARGARRATIAACPLDAEALESHLGQAGFGVDTIEIRVDPTLPRGSLRLTTPLGNLDAQLRPQLERLARTLRDSLPHA